MLMLMLDARCYSLVSLKALECPVLLQLGDDIHALQPHLPWPLLENRVPVGVCVTKGSSQRLRRLRFTPGPQRDYVAGRMLVI